jgi:hypothetical protein
LTALSSSSLTTAPLFFLGDASPPSGLSVLRFLGAAVSPSARATIGRPALTLSMSSFSLTFSLSFSFLMILRQALTLRPPGTGACCSPRQREHKKMGYEKEGLLEEKITEILDSMGASRACSAITMRYAIWSCQQTSSSKLGDIRAQYRSTRHQWRRRRHCLGSSRCQT